MLSLFVFVALFFTFVLAVEVLAALRKIASLRKDLNDLRKDLNDWKDVGHWDIHNQMETLIHETHDDFLRAGPYATNHEKHIGFKEKSLSELFATKCMKCGAALSWKRGRNAMTPTWEAPCGKCGVYNIAMVNPTVVVSAFVPFNLASNIELTLKSKVSTIHRVFP